MSEPAAAQGHTGLRQRPWWPWAKRVLLAVFLGLVGWLIATQARDMDWDQVWSSVQAYPLRTLAACAGLAAASLLLYSCFDLLGRRYSGHRLGTRSVLTVTFISYVFNLNLGSLVGGFAFRYRLYTRLGLEVQQVSQVLGLSLATNWLGYLLLAGSLFSWHPLPLPTTWKINSGGLQALGAALLLAGLAYLLVCTFSRQRSLSVRGHALTLPTARMAWLQAAMGGANWLLLGTLVHALMPASLDWASVMEVLLLAAVAGVLTHVPAGIGVLETVFIALLGQRASAHELLAALLTYRLIYYLAPLLLALLLYLLTEARARKMGSTVKPPPR